MQPGAAARCSARYAYTPSARISTSTPPSTATATSFTIQASNTNTPTQMSAAAAAHDASFDPARDYDAYEFEWQRTNAPTPNTLRGQIRRFINSGVMKVGAFQRLIGVAAAPYGRFMNGKYKNQWSASQNQTYRAAAYFFYREKKLGKNSVAKMMRKTAPAKSAVPAGVSTVQLVDAEIYLTPAEVRRGLSDVQKKYECNNTQLAGLLGAPNAGAVSRFMVSGGEFGGKDQDMYRYGAVFLEKLRVHLGKPKSKKRTAIESDTRPGKRPFLGVDDSQKFWCSRDSVLRKQKDELGRTIVTSAPKFGW